jgi:pseudomonalisin
MAILGWGVTPDTVTHLRSFGQEFDLPQTPISIKYFGGANESLFDDPSGASQTEWDLDTQASTGMAPDVQSEALYFAKQPSDADVLASIAAWVHDKKGPLQASASYGECENIPAAEPVIGVDGIEDPGTKVLEQAAIEGRTLFASTGDSGSFCTVINLGTNGVITQAYPALEVAAALPYTVAVGDTDLTATAGIRRSGSRRRRGNTRAAATAPSSPLRATRTASRRRTAPSTPPAIRSCRRPHRSAVASPTLLRSPATLRPATGC